MITRIVALGLALQLASSWASGQEGVDLIGRGQQILTEQGCHGCHTVGKMGTPIAPDLARVGNKYSLAYLARWLKDPAAQQPTAHMPKISLTETEVEALARYLASLR